MNFSFDQTEHIGVLSFKGSLTEAHALKLREVLMISWGKTPSLIISLQNVTDMHRSCLRIFCAAYRISLVTNKFFTMIGLPSDRLKSTGLNSSSCYSDNIAEFQMSGFPLECDRNCLWTYKGGY